MRLCLCGRDIEELKYISDDLKIRYGTETHIVLADLASDNFSAQVLIEEALTRIGHLDLLVIAAGDMDDKNFERMVRVNYISPVKIINESVKIMEKQDYGNIAVISSVAGDRGRQSNYLYGSTKAALTTYASGLRNLLFTKSIHILTIKPGFVDTPLTFGMKSPLIASRDKVAASIVRAIYKTKDVVYVPWFWQFIMLIIIHIPEKIFKRLRL